MHPPELEIRRLPSFQLMTIPTGEPPQLPDRGARPASLRGCRRNGEVPGPGPEEGRGEDVWSPENAEGILTRWPWRQRARKGGGRRGSAWVSRYRAGIREREDRREGCRGQVAECQPGSEEGRPNLRAKGDGDGQEGLPDSNQYPIKTWTCRAILWVVEDGVPKSLNTT